MSEPLPPSPIELHGQAKSALRDALIWISIAAAFFLVWQLASALLLILAGFVFAAGLQGGERLLGRVWKVRRMIRLVVVVLVFIVALVGFVYFAGTQLTQEFAQLRSTLAQQGERLSRLAEEYGVSSKVAEGDPFDAIKAQLGGSLGRIASFIGGAAGALGSLVLIITFGIFVAVDPRLYERGVEWLTPQDKRASLRDTVEAMGAMLRRWVAGRVVLMVFEGMLIFIGLSLVGAPLALLLGLVAGLFAFIPNLGAIASGALIIAIGFSAGTTTGLWSIGVYLVVQVADNFINPLIEKRAVDLAPAVVLAAQLLFGVLFGILGVTLADPIVALVKVALQRRNAEMQGK
ncbi:AI-2E family transporter [Glacieibacterium sp.]|uniref:AI-2E family transporter n=1 Tax=Glacieibacterium sp. TaxID=2860237 RepID=UPI003B0048E2